MPSFQQFLRLTRSLSKGLSAVLQTVARHVPPGGPAGQRRPAPLGRRLCATPRDGAALCVFFFAGLKRPRRKASVGFSLIEMLVAVAIIGLLVGLVGPAAMNQLQNSRVKSAEAQISQLRAAMDIFLIDTGRYPNEAEGLTVLVSNTAQIPGWNGPYLRDGEMPTDPWGAPFIYVSDPNGPRVQSLGADGRKGGEGRNADILG